MERHPCEIRIAAPALNDIGNIWMWTVERFGHAAATRYETLIEQAIADLADNPDCPAVRERTDSLPGLWSYHLAFSRTHVADDQAVKSPRHFVMFRQLQPGIVEILRILHDSSDLTRHFPSEMADE